MMSEKLATQGLLKVKVFWNKGYNVIIYDNDVSNKKFITLFKLYCRSGHVIKVW